MDILIAKCFKILQCENYTQYTALTYIESWIRYWFCSNEPLPKQVSPTGKYHPSLEYTKPTLTNLCSAIIIMSVYSIYRKHGLRCTDIFLCLFSNLLYFLT